MEEIWKRIPNYSKYEASNLGNIKTFNWKNKGIERIMKPSADACGYLRTMLQNDNGKFDTIKVHRIIAATFCGNPDNKPEVNHIDCNRANNQAHNLEWCTRSENILHAYKEGSMDVKGGKNPAATLTDDQVREIISIYPFGRTHRKAGEISKKELAEKYNTSVSVIKRIAQKQTWKHLF